MTSRLRLLRGAPAGFLAIFVLLALALAAACGGDGDDEEAAPAVAEQAAPAATEETATSAKTGVVKIGVMAALSGDFAAFETVRNGIVQSINEINAAGGFQVGDTLYTLEAFERDTRSEVSVAVASAQELINDVGVNFLFGPLIDHFVGPIMELTAEAQVLFFTASAIMNNALTPTTVLPGGVGHYLFKTHPGDDDRDGVFYATADRFFGLGADTREVLMMPDDTIGQLIAPETEVRRAGPGSVHEGNPDNWTYILYPPGTTDFTPYLTRAKAFNPDIVHFWYIPDETIAVFSQALELDVASTYALYGPDPNAFREKFPDPLEVEVMVGCVPLCVGAPSSQRASEYWDRYGPAWGLTTTSGYSGLYYDYVPMLVEAMKIAGSVDDVDAIVVALENLVYVDGVLTPLSFDSRHVANHGWDFCKISGGEYTCEFNDAANTPYIGGTGIGE